MVNVELIKGGNWLRSNKLSSNYSKPVAQPAQKLGGEFAGGKLFTFRRITLFCLEKHLSKQKMTIFSKHLGRSWPLCPPLATPMLQINIYAYKIFEKI